jgi:hypothetical protein
VSDSTQSQVSFAAHGSNHLQAATHQKLQLEDGDDQLQKKKKKKQKIISCGSFF